jgi:hypothetical protein
MSNSPRRFELTVLPGDFAMVRLASDAPIPTWAMCGTFFSVTRTRDELSIVCSGGQIPEWIPAELGWRVLKVKGPFALSEIGVLAELSVRLAEARVSVFAISTFDTDYLLVGGKQLQSAITALRDAGHQIEESSAAS